MGVLVLFHTMKMNDVEIEGKYSPAFFSKHLGGRMDKVKWIGTTQWISHFMNNIVQLHS
jgi:hypothetical protein